MRRHPKKFAGFASLILLPVLFILGAMVVLPIVHAPADALKAQKAAELDAQWRAACYAGGGEIRTRREKRLRFNYRNRYKTITIRYCYKQTN